MQKATFITTETVHSVTSIISTLGKPIRPPKKKHNTPSVINVENVHFDWFNQYLCKGEHLQSDLDMFQFDFMFVKPHDVHALLCFNVQTEMWFWLQQLLFPEGRHC